jgi:hypothetical protein
MISGTIPIMTESRPEKRRPPAYRAAWLSLALAACATQDTHTPDPAPADGSWRSARIVEAAAPLECVTFARQATGFDLRGDAWTWWGAAKGRYGRGVSPQPGSLLVFKRFRKSAGHLAVVTRVIDDRLVVASHANWLNSGHIHEHTPIRDVSARGDWSEVRVWYVPGQSWGRRVYPAYGFIYPIPTVAGR